MTTDDDRIKAFRSELRRVADKAIRDVMREARERGRMSSHELAAHLLALPDLPVATHARGYVHASGCDGDAHGPMKIGRLAHYSGDHIVIGDISKRNVNGPNEFITEMYVGNAPWEWWQPGNPLGETDAQKAAGSAQASKWLADRKSR